MSLVHKKEQSEWLDLKTPIFKKITLSINEFIQNMIIICINSNTLFIKNNSILHFGLFKKDFY
jgi:hypothetical protein